MPDRFWPSFEQEEALQAEVKAEIDAAVKEFEDIKNLPPEACFEHTFRTQHEELEEQKQEFLRNLRKETGNG